jgi:murein L,D-transpeptidase YcbB/YkuD
MNCRFERAALLLASLLGFACPGGAATPGLPLDRAGEALRERVDLLRADGRVVVAGEEIVSHVALPMLYEDAGFRLQWREPQRLESLVAAIRGVEADGLEPNDYHHDALARLAATTRADATPVQRAELDLLATDAFVIVLYHLYMGKVDPLSIEPTWNFDTKSVKESEALAFLQRALESGRIREALDEVRPKHWMYESGRRALAQYRSIQARGGWDPVPAGPSLKPGMTDPRVPALRRHLAVTGDYAGDLDASATYDAALVAAVQVFQGRHQLTPDGTVGPGTLRELNVPVRARIDQIRVNLERARWVLGSIAATQSDQVIVDIAGFGVRYVRNSRVIWQSRAIVGQEARQTPTFRAQIDRVIFNPTWTVPPGILEKDVIPGMRRGTNVLARKHLKVYDRQNRPVDPATIDWKRYNGRNFPYFLRQDSGDENALGRVKIDFPNPHLVYLHDTPTRSLFDKDKRTFSSGCIRVENALELARILLNDPERWSADAIRKVVDAGQTRTVPLATKVPVLLIYWTVDQDAMGRVVFKRDVYDRDPPLLRALDAKFRFGSRTRA